MKICKRILFRPLQILLFLIMIILALFYIIDPKLEFLTNILYIIIIHLALLVIELIIECLKLYKIYLNDYKTNSQPANVIFNISFCNFNFKNLLIQYHLFKLNFLFNKMTLFYSEKNYFLIY
jgi:hypothetical protein